MNPFLKPPVSKKLKKQQRIDIMKKIEILQQSDLMRDLDLLDQEALRAWYQANKANARTRTEKKIAIIEAKRVIDLYSLYGSEYTALVNPVNAPGRIEVRDRVYAEYKVAL